MKRISAQDLDAAKERLRIELTAFNGTKPAEITSQLERFEACIARTLVAEVSRYLASTDRQVRPTPERSMFVVNGTFYQVAATPRSALSPSGLDISVLQVNVQKPPKPVRVHGSVKGFGRVTSTTSIVDPRFAAYADDITYLTTELYEFGYSLMLELIRQVIDELETDLSKHLYEHVRPLLPMQMLKFFWFNIITEDGGGIYLFDRHSAENTVSLLTSHERRRSLAPAELFAHLLVTAIPFEQMFSKNVIATGECLSVPLTVTDYRDSSIGYSQAEDFIYPGKSASVYPIVREGSAFLVASFPTVHEVTLLPVLHSSRVALSHIFKDHRSIVLRTLRKVRDSFHWLPQEFIAEVLAKTVVEFTKWGSGSA
jgi:hypothetical protein